MSRRRLFLLDNLEEARQLRKAGYSKRKLADYYQVAPTTIWENVYSTPKPPPKKQRFLFLRIKSVPLIVSKKKQEGYTSGEIAEELNIPLSEVNHMYIQYGPAN